MRKLPNYLKTHRKRLALSQDEVAFLLGNRSGAKASRHERFSREPTLITALAYEAIFDVPVSELFAGLYQNVEAEVVGRARILTFRVEKGKPTPESLRKRDTILRIASREKSQRPTPR